MLALILFVFGASNGAMDVAMNAHGVAIQESAQAGRSCRPFTAAGASADSSPPELVAIAAAAGSIHALKA